MKTDESSHQNYAFPIIRIVIKRLIEPKACKQFLQVLVDQPCKGSSSKLLMNTKIKLALF